jgi:HlyD family secretion protein
MANKINFSEKALNNLGNNIGDNTLRSIKNFWNYFLLSAVTILFATLLIWGFCGRISENVSGTGITLLNNGYHPIIAHGTGTLSHLNINVGTTVIPGQTVGQIHNPELFFNISKLGNEYNSLISEMEILRRGIEKLTARKTGSETQRKKILAQLTELQRKSRQRAKEIVEIHSSLRQSGAVSKITYFQALDNQTQSEISFANTLFESLSNDLSSEETLWQYQRQLLEMQQTLSQKKRELDLALRLFQESNWISSNHQGKVTEIFKKEGSFVQNGETIALLSSDPADGIYIAAFIPALQSKEIKCGMGVFFSPAIAPASRYGYIKGIVREVNLMPSNPEAIQSELANESLTRQIVGQGAVIRVVVELLPDSGTPSGFAWTTKRGYPGKIPHGVVGEVIINTGKRSPASYILPALKDFFDNKHTRSLEQK